MNRQELDALIQGGIDHSLTPDEQVRLAEMLSESPELRERVAQLTNLVDLIESLGPAEAPAGLAEQVLAEVSHRPHVVRHSTFQRGVPVNKKILFGLAAAAAIVLAVITYNSNPPATVGTEATIGTAQRAQTPQIAPSDVKLGDTSTQDVLQTETFDAIIKDETLRSALQDEELIRRLQDAEFRGALRDEAIRKALADPEIIRRLSDENFRRMLNDPAVAAKKLEDANARALLASRAMVDALRNDHLRSLLARPGVAAALSRSAMQRALADRGFEASLKTRHFAEELRTGVRANVRANARGAQ